MGGKTKVKMDKTQQAKARPTRMLTQQDFADNNETAVYWLTSAGAMINSHGTILFVDPVLAYIDGQPMVSETFEILLVPTPIQPEKVPKCDAVFYTHMDYDHLSENTLQKLKYTTDPDFYIPSQFVYDRLKFYGVAPDKRKIIAPGEKVVIGNVTVERTPARHAWQVIDPEHYDWTYQPEDCTGYKITTPDGIIWVPGDTQLLPEHLEMTDVDVMFIDFARSQSHLGEENAIRLANTLTRTDMIMYHYGTFKAEGRPDFSANPDDVRDKFIHPERFHDLAPGEKYVLKSKH